MDKRTPVAFQAPFNPRQRTAALAKLAERSLWETAIDSLLEFKEAGWRLDAIAFNAALSACHRAGQWSAIFASLVSMRADGPWPDTISHNAALTALARRSHWSSAQTLFNEVRSKETVLPPTIITFNAAINAFERAGLWRDACRLLGLAPGARLTPTVITYSSAISACQHSGNWVAALKLLTEMLHEGVIPNAITFSSAVSACEKAGAWEWAAFLLQEMRSSRVEPNAITFNAMVSSCEKADIWERAILTLGTMDSLGLESDIISFNAALRAYVPAQAWGRAVHMLDTVRKLNIQTDVITFSAAMATGGSEHLDWSLKQLKVMRAENMELDIIAVGVGMAVCSERLTAWDRSLQLLHDTDQRGIQVNVYAHNAMMHSFSVNGRWQEALRNFDAAPVRGLELDSVSFNTLVETLVNVGLRNLAADVYKNGVESGVLQASRTSRHGIRRHLDLHGMPSSVAATAVRSTLRDASQDGMSEKYLMIVTGQGKHSETAPVIRPSIMSMLRDEIGIYYKADEHGGALNIQAKQVKRLGQKSRQSDSAESKKYGRGSSSSSSLAAMRAALPAMRAAVPVAL